MLYPSVLFICFIQIENKYLYFYCSHVILVHLYYLQNCNIIYSSWFVCFIRTGSASKDQFRYVMINDFWNEIQADFLPQEARVENQPRLPNLPKTWSLIKRSKIWFTVCVRRDITAGLCSIDFKASGVLKDSFGDWIYCI